MSVRLGINRRAKKADPEVRPAVGENGTWFEAKNLWVGYGGGAPVVRDVSLHVAPREIVGLIGSNGAGKSTFLRAVSGLLKVREGEISFRGERIENLPPHEIVAKGVVQVPEGRQLFADMSIRDNLRLGAYLRRDTRAVTSDADNLTETFPVLRTRLNQRAGTASGGEQQILAIARALMAKPRLLLLDEPSMGLAPRIVKEVADIVREISRGYDVGIILVEQNATMALSVADRTYVMELGRIRITGSSAELRRDDRVRRAYLSE